MKKWLSRFDSRGTSLRSIRKAWNLIPRVEKPQVLILASIQIGVSLIDVIGVMLTGLVGVISVNSLQSGLPSNAVLRVLTILGLEGQPLNRQLQILAGATILILIGKTFASIHFAKLTTRLLSSLSASTSAKILDEYLNLPFSEVRRLTQQEAIFATTRGVNTAILGIVGSAVGFGVDAVLVITLSVVLILISPISGVVFISLFAVIWQILKNQLHKQSELLSKRETEISIETSNLISNSLDSYKELFVLNRLSELISQLTEKRKELGKITAITSFNPQYAKYIFEFGIVAITFSVTAIQLWQYDASRAAGTITLFVAAGARMSPALLRMQQNFLILSSSAGAAGPTLALSEQLRKFGAQKPFDVSSATNRKFVPEIDLVNLCFSYDGSKKVINNLNLTVNPGDFLAITGPSGVGKSTLIDLCLGILQPVSGSISISGISPFAAIKMWPGKIAYVPQSVHLANMSLRDNITFFSNVTEGVDQRCLSVLAQAGLAEEFAKMKLTLDTILGSDQNSLSGGQVQRIGIARALFSNPDLLILDESTSSLDA